MMQIKRLCWTIFQEIVLCLLIKIACVFVVFDFKVYIYCKLFFSELHPKTTHLLVKESMVGKTDKLLGSLARGDVTICDHRPFLKIAGEEVIRYGQ